MVTIRTTRFKIHKLYVLPTQCIYVFCVDLRTNSDCFHNLHRVRSLRGTDRILISSPSSSSCSRRVRCFSCSLILKMHWSLHLFLGRPIFLRPFGLYCSACFGSLFVSIHCTCCRHFFWYCFISFTMFSAPIFLIRWYFSLSSFVIPSKCLKNFICGVSKRCSSLFFSTQASLPNFNAALAVT